MAVKGRKESPVDVLESLRGELESGDFSPLYLLHGPGGFFRDEAEGMIRKAALAGAAAGFNFDRFDPEGFDIRRALGSANTLPMMADRRLVLIRDLHRLDASSQAQLAEYAKAPNPTTVLLLVAEKLDGRGALAKALNTQGRVLEFRALYDNEVPRLINAEARRLGKTVSQGGVRLLQETIGASPADLRMELTKASLYVGENDRIDEADLAAIASDVGADTLFAFLDAVGYGQADEALRRLDRLAEDDGVAFRLVPMIHRQLRQIGQARELLQDQGQEPAAVARELGFGDRMWLFEKGLLPQAKGWDKGGIEAALGVIQRSHRRLRSRAPSTRVLEAVILDICRLRNRSRAAKR